MRSTKPLTGWLILLIVILGVESVTRGSAAIGKVAESYREFYDAYPSLFNAVMMFQVLGGISIVTGIYTAWVLYRRVPGSLPRAQNGLLVTGALRVVAPGTIPLFGGLPAEASNELIQDWLITGLALSCVTAAWYWYLCRSQRVQEIYAPSV